MRRPAPLTLRARSGARQLACCLPLGLLVGLMASASHAQSSPHTHHATATASAQVSDPNAATARLQHAPMVATPGLTPAKADWRAANQTVAEAAQAAMPGMDHSAHGAGQAAPASQNPQPQMGSAHTGHMGHTVPGHAPSGDAGERDAAAHGHMHGAMHPEGAASHAEAVRNHLGEKSSGRASIPQGCMQHPAGQGHTQHRHGGQP